MVAQHIQKPTRIAVAFSLLIGTLVSALSGVASAEPSVTPIAAIGQQHVVALGSNGTVWTWGSLIPGPTGVGSKDALPKPTEVVLPSSRTAVSVAATYNASFAVANDGSVWGWGSLGRGLGNSTNTTDSRYVDPVQVVFPAGVSVVEVSAACEGVMARTSSGDVYQWGSFYGNWSMSYAQPTKVAGVANTIAITRGCNSSFAITSNRSAYAWGSNGGGRLGDGTTTDRSTPVLISLPESKLFKKISSSSSHALAVATDGTVWAWGGNSQGQLARDPNALAYAATPRQISLGSSTGVSVIANDSTPFSTVITNTGAITRWGGWGTTEYVPAPMALPTSQLGSRLLIDGAMYNYTGVFIANDNSMWAKGYSWGSTDLDGNCGASASDYNSWYNGKTIPAKPLVRVHSNGQFGSNFSEDTIEITKLQTASGGNLPLDGSGSITGTVGTQTSVVVTSPRSSCFSTEDLEFAISVDNGNTWNTSGITREINNYSQTVVTVPLTPISSGRNRAVLKISNPTGQFEIFKFTLAVAAAPSGAGQGSASVLPVLITRAGTTLSIGSDGYLYAWGAASLITGSADPVLSPTRIVPATGSNPSTTKFRSISMVSSDGSDGKMVALAVSEIGEMYVWGKGSEDLVLGTTSDIAAPTKLAMPTGRYVVSAALNTIPSCFGNPCNHRNGLLGIAIDDTGSVNAWGLGTNQDGTNSYYMHYGASPSPVTQLVGTSYTSVDALVSDYMVILRGQDGDLYRWNPSYASSQICSPTCERTGFSAVYVGQFSSKLSRGYIYGDDYRSSESGYFDVTSDGKLRFSSVTNNGQLGTRKTFSLSGGLKITDIAIQDSGSEPSVIAEDGTVWSFNQWDKTATKFYKTRLPVAVYPVSRFASLGGVNAANYFVGSGGNIWTRSAYSASCANPRRIDSRINSYYDYENGDSYLRIPSTGEFGTSFTEDAFAFGIDSPQSTSATSTGFPWEPYPSKVTETLEFPGQLRIRPGDAIQLYTYFFSSCQVSGTPTISWDLDDNGTFETNGVVETVETSATRLTTASKASNSEEEDYVGLPDAYKQSKVEITADSPGGAFANGGARYIGVRLVSTKGSTTQRIPIIVEPTPPSGRPGISINAGARFTDSAEVDLSMVWNGGYSTAIISNDGGFTDAQEIPLSSKIRWKLPTDGSGLLSTTVYVRFKNISPNGEGGWGSWETDWNYTDDIVLDLSPPEVSSLSASSNAASAQSVKAQSSGASALAATQAATISMSAFDSASGIAAVQVTTDPAIPGPQRAYARNYTIPIDRGTVAVRVKDNVGHWSDWKYTSISGFVAQPETPTEAPVAPKVPNTPMSPAVVSPPAAPAAPVAPPALAPATTTTVKAVLAGATAKVSIAVPSELAKTCKTTTVKGKKVSTCKAAPIVVSVSGGKSKIVNAKAGNNSISIPAKKGQTITVKVNGKVVQKIKM